LWAASGPADTFRFTILGDRTGTAVPEIYDRVWSEISLLHPDFVINVGDSIQGGDDARAAAEWAAVRSVWDRHRHPPLYLVPGNHDIWSQASEAAFTAASGRKPFYSFDYGPAHFTVLDNSRNETLSDDQMKFLESDLAANVARHPKFVFFHRCFWVALLKLESGDFPLHRAARRYGVDYVVSGHGHQFLRMARDGIAYTEVGSSGASLEGALARGEGFPQGRFYHHVWVTVTGPSARFTVKEIGEPYGKGRMFDAADWGVNGPRPPA
jgi:3',5'-cyclic AMP phosphodiesterase CpdA